MHRLSLGTVPLFHTACSCDYLLAAAGNSCCLQLAAKICTSSRCVSVAQQVFLCFCLLDEDLIINIIV